MSEENTNKVKYTMDEGYMSVHELLAANGVNQRMLVESLEKEESIERVETEDEIKADIESQRLKTNLAKERLINEIKSGLGTEILENPSKVTIIKKPWYKRLMDFFKSLFTRF